MLLNLIRDIGNDKRNLEIVLIVPPTNQERLQTIPAPITLLRKTNPPLLHPPLLTLRLLPKTIQIPTAETLDRNHADLSPKKKSNAEETKTFAYIALERTTKLPIVRTLQQTVNRRPDVRHSPSQPKPMNPPSKKSIRKTIRRL